MQQAIQPTRRLSRRGFLAATAGVAATALSGCSASGHGVLRNVSYDPTRKLFEEINGLFLSQWQNDGYTSARVEQSHGGSGKQARAVLDGLDADVVTLALAYDIDAIAARSTLLPKDWQLRLPNNSCPYTSVILFLVRRGNPKGIRDWEDLARPGVTVITPNPKTSGGARWNHLAAWAAARQDSTESGAREFLGRLYRNVPVLDSGARGATTTFVQRRLGDALITWESEAHLAQREFAHEGLEVVLPRRTMLAEPPVALVDAIAARRGNTAMAQTYLEFLYTSEAQRAIIRHGFRGVPLPGVAPSKPSGEAITLMSINQHFGGWRSAHQKHFAEGAIFDQVQTFGN